MKELKPATVREELESILPDLTRFALFLTRDSEAARDLVQSCCLRALSREHQYEQGTRLDRWLFAIMSSEWKNQLRSMATRRGMGETSAVHALTSDFATEADAQILSKQILDAVERLPPTQREAVQTVYLEGFTYREAAKHLSIPIGTLMTTLARARSALSQYLRIDDD